MPKPKHAFSLRNLKVGVVGLGYVGLPLAVEFGRHLKTVGFDIKPDRIRQLQAGKDRKALSSSDFDRRMRELEAADRELDAEIRKHR